MCNSFINSLEFVVAIPVGPTDGKVFVEVG